MALTQANFNSGNTTSIWDANPFFGGDGHDDINKEKQNKKQGHSNDYAQIIQKLEKFRFFYIQLSMRSIKMSFQHGHQFPKNRR